MKQVALATIPMLCAAIAPICADAQRSNTSNSASDKQNAEMQKQYMHEMNKITPSAEPAVTRWADPFVTADFIYWRAQEDGLQYALNGVSSGNGPLVPTTPLFPAQKGKVHHARFEYEPGFKVGAGLKFRHDGWDAYAQYTWWRSERDESKSKVSATPGFTNEVVANIFYPNGNNGLLETFRADSANAKWSMMFNVLDLELGRNFWISKWLTLRPFVGMKFSWINQKFHHKFGDVYSSGNSLAAVPTFAAASGNNFSSHNHMDQFGVGMRSGLNTAWYMAKRWAIFGDLAITGMWNDFDVSRKDYIESPTLSKTKSFRARNDMHNVTAILEWALGLRFETAFHHDDFMFMMEAGWESQVWFGQNAFLNPGNQTPGNLSLQGLTIKAGFYF